jgi:hypothetical protein
MRPSIYLNPNSSALFLPHSSALYCHLKQQQPSGSENFCFPTQFRLDPIMRSVYMAHANELLYNNQHNATAIIAHLLPRFTGT